MAGELIKWSKVSNAASGPFRSGEKLGIAGRRMNAIADRAEGIGVAGTQEVRQLVGGDLGRQHREVVLAIGERRRIAGTADQAVDLDLGVPAGVEAAEVDLARLTAGLARLVRGPVEVEHDPVGRRNIGRLGRVLGELDKGKIGVVGLEPGQDIAQSAVVYACGGSPSIGSA